MATLLDPYIPLIGYLLVWGAIILIAILLKAERHGILAKPYYLMLKTAHFNSWMEKLGNKWRRGWLTFFNIGAATGIGILILAIYVMANSLIQLIFRTPAASPTVLIVPIPGVAVRWDIFPYILIAIAAVLIPHEVAHGIASVLDKVPIKSSGVFFAVVLPGGFVEIDEEDLAKRRSRTKLRVFAAGSFTNIVSAALVLLLVTASFPPTPSGVLIADLTAGGPAASAGIPQWSVITALNGIRVVQRENITTILAPASPGDTVTVQLSDGRLFHLTTQRAPENASRAIIGITASLYPYHAAKVSWLPPLFSYHAFNELNWMLAILFGVGLVNMLPLVPFDGDRYFDTVLNRLGLKKTKRIRTFASVLSLSLLVLNLAFTYSVFGRFLLT